MFNMNKNEELGLIEAEGCDIVKVYESIVMVMCERQ